MSRPPLHPPKADPVSDMDQIMMDALRWRALMSCARIDVEATTIPRTALYDQQHMPNSRYINVSFWTTSAIPTTHFGIPLLEDFTDKIIEEFDL